MKMLLQIVLMLLFLMPATLFAQSMRHHIGNTEKLGSVTFPTSCSPSVQNEFQRGVALLHSFAYEDAIAAFKDLETRDPVCGMAYWGEAMSYYHQAWEDLPDSAHLQRGLEACRKARAIGAGTERERAYIAAISSFYDDWQHVDHLTRVLKYQSAMQQMSDMYSDDRESAVFYALSLIATASTKDPSFADRRRAGAILEKVFAEYPDHPGVAHYIIHAYDNPILAGRALDAARRYAQIAPSSVHALHMPSHIFIQVGSWQEAIHSNLASISAAREYSRKNRLEGIWDMQAHALDYLAYAYLQIARDQDAKRVLSEVEAAHDRRTGESQVASYSAFAGIPARYALERKQWDEACSLVDHNLPNAIYEAETFFARAVGCARSGNLKAARDSVAQLSKLQEMDAPPPTLYSDPNFIEIQKRAAGAWLALAEKKDAEAVRLMQSAVDLEKSTLATWVPAPVLPALEQLGDLLLELNRPREALEAFETSMVATPNRFNALYGAARAAELAGNLVKARMYYAKIVDNCKDSKSDRPDLVAAKDFLQKQDVTPTSRSLYPE